VVVFSKTTCPFCRRTKDLFDGLDVKYTAVELDDFNTHLKPYS
jgi:glutaredoxin